MFFRKQQQLPIPSDLGPTSQHSQVKKQQQSSLVETTPLIETIPNNWASSLPKIGKQDFVDYMNFEAIKPTTMDDQNAVCLNYTGLIVAIVVFLLVQIILAILWTRFSQKRKRKHEKDEFVKTMFNPYAVATTR